MLWFTISLINVDILASIASICFQEATLNTRGNFTTSLQHHYNAKRQNCPMKLYGPDYTHLTNTFFLTLKMTSTQVVKMPVINNSFFQTSPHPDNLTTQLTDTPGFKSFATCMLL